MLTIFKYRWYFILLAVIVVIAGWLYCEISETAGSFWPSVATKDPLGWSAGIRESDVRGELGALGDVFGGLMNPFLTFISIILLIHTIRLTQETNKSANQALQEAIRQNILTEQALSLTHKQLDISNKEMEMTRKELAGAAKAQEEIANTQAEQKLESAFFELFKIYSDRVSEYHMAGGCNKSKSTIPMDFIIKKVFQTSGGSSPKSIVRQEYENDIFFRKLVQLTVVQLELIKDSNNLKLVLKSIMSSELKCLLCLLAHSSNEPEVDRLSNVLKNSKIFVDESNMTSGSGIQDCTDELDIAVNEFTQFLVNTSIPQN